MTVLINFDELSIRAIMWGAIALLGFGLILNFFAKFPEKKSKK